MRNQQQVSQTVAWDPPAFLSYRVLVLSCAPPKNEQLQHLREKHQTFSKVQCLIVLNIQDAISKPCQHCKPLCQPLHVLFLQISAVSLQSTASQPPSSDAESFRRCSWIRWKKEIRWEDHRHCQRHASVLLKFAGSACEVCRLKQ